MKHAAILLIATATAALAFETPPWPSPSYPREGAQHSDDVAYSIRERECAADIPEVWLDPFGWDEWYWIWTAVYHPVWLYRRQHQNLVDCKDWVATNYVHFTFIGDRTIYDMKNIMPPAPWYSFDAFISSVQDFSDEPPDDYFTNTPYRGLFKDDYGWRHMPKVMSWLVATEKTVSWTDALLCSNETYQTWGPSITVTSACETVSNSYANLLPFTRYGWFYDFEPEDCPLFPVGAEEWPEWTFYPGECTSGVSVAGQEPMWEMSIESDIEFWQSFRMRSYPTNSTADTAWQIRAFSCGNTQNSYTARESWISAIPCVSGLCTNVAKTVQFYISVGGGAYELYQTVEAGYASSACADRVNPDDLWTNRTLEAAGTCTVCDTPRDASLPTNEWVIVPGSEWQGFQFWYDTNSNGVRDGAEVMCGTTGISNPYSPLNSYDWYWDCTNEPCTNAINLNCDIELAYAFQTNVTTNLYGYIPPSYLGCDTNFTNTSLWYKVTWDDVYTDVLDVLHNQSLTGADIVSQSNAVVDVRAVVWWNTSTNGFQYTDVP